MASKRKQVNIRVSDETLELMPRLIEAIDSKLGTETVNADLFRMGLQLLKQKYLDESAEEEPSRLKKTTKQTGKKK